MGGLEALFLGLTIFPQLVGERWSRSDCDPVIRYFSQKSRKKRSHF
jgi:hypothetical protein